MLRAECEMGAVEWWQPCAVGAVDKSAQGGFTIETQRGTSLLPAGVRDVNGEFDEGDTVEVCTVGGDAYARGMVFASSTALRAVAGRQTSDLPAGMVHEVIHRDDLIVLGA